MLEVKKAPSSGAFPSGGAGNRTPVRASIRKRAYVRRLRSWSPPSGSQPTTQRTSPLAISRSAKEHGAAPARICDTYAPPQAGCHVGRCSKREA